MAGKLRAKLIAACLVAAAWCAPAPGREGSGKVWVPPFYFEGLGYKVIPPLLSGRWQHADGAQSTWITPFFHKTVEADGALRHMHALNYFQGPGYKVFFPFAYKTAEHAGVVPFYFRGPGYNVSPPLLSGQWRHSDGSQSTWITPLFHKTVDSDGSVRHFHLMNYLQGPNYKVLFPLVWHRRREDATATLVFPVWWSHRPEPGRPMRCSILGGLFARDCDYDRGTHRYRILWLIPLGRWKDSTTGLAREHPVEAERDARPPEEARGRGPARKSVRELIRELNDEDSYLRRSAAVALGRLGPAAKQAVPALAKLLEDKNFDVRKSAAEAMAAVGADALPALVKALAGVNRNVRWCAAYALGEMGPAAGKAVPALTKALEDTDRHVRRCVAEALGKIQERE